MNSYSAAKSMLKACVCAAIVLHSSLLYAQSSAVSALLQKTDLPGFSSPVMAYHLDSEKNASGIPLGGMGAGFIELMPDGKFGRTAFRSNLNKPVPAPQMRLTLSDGTGKEARHFTLLSSLPDEHTAITDFVGHFPVADMAYSSIRGDALDVKLRAMSSFIPGNLNLSCLPGFLVKIKLRNTSSSAKKISLAFSLVNDQDPIDSIDSPGKQSLVPFRSANGIGFTLGKTVGRAGNCILARTDGWTPHAGKVAGSKEGEAGAVLLTCDLPPAIDKEAIFSFSWYSVEPQKFVLPVGIANYRANYLNAEGVANFLLTNHIALEHAVVAWQQAIYNRNLPDWLKDALINSLYIMNRSVIAQEDGRIITVDAGQKAMVPSGITDALNSGIPLLLFFPNSVRQFLTDAAKSQLADGRIPSLFALADPGKEADSSKSTVATAAYLILMHRYFTATGDLEFIKANYPIVKKALQFVFSQTNNGDGLILENRKDASGSISSHFLDNWIWSGLSSPTAILGLSAISCAGDLAKVSGDTETEMSAKSTIEKGLAKLDDELYTGEYYRLFTDPDKFTISETIYVNQLRGYTHTMLNGLPGALKPANVSSAIKTILNKNRSESVYGLRSGVTPEGKPDTSGAAQSSEVIFSDIIDFSIAAHFATKDSGDAELRKGALEAVRRTYEIQAQRGSLWNLPFVQDTKTGKPISGNFSVLNLNIWGLPLAIEGVSMVGRAPGNGRR